MSAGAAATAIITDAGVTSHHVDASLPHKPRVLSRPERSRRETFVYYSPRNSRIVTLCEAINIALALKFEFDASLETFVERPRRIALSAKQEIDLSFWTRGSNGEESYYLVIPNAGTMGSTSGTVAIRDRQVLDEAAQRHGLNLHYITEKELITASAELAAYWQLLAHVQHYRRLLNRVFIRASIQAVFACTPSSTLRQIVHQLQERFLADQVTAVVAGMIHGGSLRITEFGGFSQDTLLEVIHGA